MYYAYILLCINTKQSRKIFYIGCTDSLEKRIRNHKSKSVKTTKRFDKVILVYYEACENKIDAIKREKQLKTGFGRGYLKKRLGNYLKNIGQS